MPTWLMAVVFAFAFMGLGFGVFYLIGYLRGTPTKPSATVESPTAKPGAKTNPYQRYIEVSGVRLLQDAKKRNVAKFLVVNHSGADIQGLSGNVTIWGRTQKSEEEAAGTFTFTIDLAPFESKEIIAPLNTKLAPVELPDWQNVSTDLQITAPAVSGG